MHCPKIWGKNGLIGNNIKTEECEKNEQKIQFILSERFIFVFISSKVLKIKADSSLS